MADELEDSRHGSTLDELLNDRYIEDWSIPELTDLIEKRVSLNRKQIAYKIDIEYSKFHKWSNSLNKPSSLDEEVKVKRALIRIINEYNNQLQEGTIKYQTKIPELKYDLYHPLIGIPLYEDGEPETYTGSPVPLGTIKNVNGKDCLIACRNTLPSIFNIDGIISVSNDGLGNRFEGGLLIAITKQLVSKILFAGYYYVIANNGRGILRKIKNAEPNGLTLISDVKGEDNITISLDDIVAIFSVEWFFTRQFPDNEK